MPDEADEAGGLMPANEENEARYGFSPEKPCLPLSIEGRVTPMHTHYIPGIFAIQHKNKRIFTSFFIKIN